MVFSIQVMEKLIRSHFFFTIWPQPKSCLYFDLFHLLYKKYILILQSKDV